MQIQSLILGGRDCANPATGPWVDGRGTKLAMASWKQIHVNVRNGIIWIQIYLNVRNGIMETD